MLKCVLVGLNWVLPMMYLFLHVTCSCIFHAYISSLFSLFASICDVFSFFLPLSDRLCMAPKHKSTPAQNPLNSESFSSDLTPPLHIRFCEEKAHQDFSKNFSKRGVHPKCHVILSDFANTPLPNVIHTRGWESLCEIPLRCPIVFIQEFYSNMHYIDK